MIVDDLMPEGGKSQPSSLGPSAAGMLLYADGVHWNPMNDGVARWVMWTGTVFVPAMLPFATRTSLTPGVQRVFGTAYQNTHNSMMFVAVVVAVAAGTTTIALSDPNATPTTQVARFDNSGGTPVGGSLSFLVFPGSYYQVNASGATTAVTWIEYT